MKPWQVVTLCWTAAAFAGVYAGKYSTHPLEDWGVAAFITLLGVCLIRGRRAGR
jgi:hypothetical protein